MRLFTVHNLVGDHPEFASTRLFLFNLGMGSFCIDTHCVFHNSLAAIAAVSECIKCQNAPLLAIFLSVMAAAHLGVNKGRLFGLCWNLYRGGIYNSPFHKESIPKRGHKFWMQHS